LYPETALPPLFEGAVQTKTLLRLDGFTEKEATANGATYGIAVLAGVEYKPRPDGFKVAI
jgi:hypothetical protein